MMQDTLDVLDSTGHITITWRQDDPDELEHARREVRRLKAAGYRFFAVAGANGTDEVEAGAGRLLAEHVDDPTEPPAEVAASAAPAEDVTVRQRRGAGRRSVAIRPMQGG